jgi:hypothetical protein
MLVGHWHVPHVLSLWHVSVPVEVPAQEQSSVSPGLQTVVSRALPQDNANSAASAMRLPARIEPIIKEPRDVNACTCETGRYLSESDIHVMPTVVLTGRA